MGRIPLTLSLAGILSWALALAAVSHAQPVNRQVSEEPTMWTNWKTPTFGGRQFWTDVVHRSGWRIQRHADTGHHRLLDPKQVRHAWGSLEQCQFQFEREISAGQVAPNRRRVVILLHGLMRSSESMRPMAQFLEQHGDFQAINFEYASSRADIATHARDLDHLIRHLGNEVEEVHFVAHSMGNIVVRRYLGDQRHKGHAGGDSRIARMVMIGPPNQGSRMARTLQNNWVFKWIAGTAGSELGKHWDRLAPTLATPHFEFGIIAGAQAEGSKLKNFVLEGPDDFTVSLAETRLPGAVDTWVRPLLHSNMMKQPEVMDVTLQFLRHGWFESSETRVPIPLSEEPEGGAKQR